MPRTQLPKFTTLVDAVDYWSKKHPNKKFLIDISANVDYSYAEFATAVRRTALFLRKQGVTSGSIVSIRIRNSCEFLIIYFATLRAGGTINPFPASMSDEEFEKSLSFIKPHIVFTEQHTAKKLSKKFAVFPIAFSGQNSFRNLIDIYPARSLKWKINPLKPACLYHSSGTTSDPKGILYSHKNMTSLIASLCKEFHHTGDTVHFGFLPMGHTAITNYSFLPVAYVGGTLVFAENFFTVRNRFWEILKTYSVNYVEVVPTVLFSILNIPFPDFSKRELRLKYVGCGSAPLPQTIQKAFQKKFDIPVANLYGLSETGPSHFDNPLRKSWKPGSIGYPLGVNTCAIFDENRKKLGVNKIGEIALKGPNVFVGYYKNPSAYSAVMHKGFFMTGDLGYRDQKGLYYYVDRKKDLIIKGGSNIFPGEIDEILFKHPAVLETSTVGVPDNFYGEEIISFVVLKKPIPEEILMQYCAKHLQKSKRPKRIFAVASIPKTHSGKLLRRTLRELYDTLSKKN